MSVPIRGTHCLVVGASQRDRVATIAALDLPAPLLPQISAHRRLRGPYTVAGSIARALVPDTIVRWPDLVASHEVEILAVAPELAPVVPSTLETLMSRAIPIERIRGYPRSRTSSAANGLVEFLRDTLMRSDVGVRSIVVDGFDDADPTDQEFLEVLLRRIDPQLLVVVVGATYDVAAIRRHVTYVAAGPTSDRDAEPEAPSRLAERYVANDGINNDPVLLAAYDSLSPAEKRILHDTRADELASQAEQSLALGAIPFHRERGSDPAGSGAAALRAALNYCVDLGYYDAAADLGRRGRMLVDWEQHSEPRWAFTSKLATSLTGLGKAVEAEALYDEVRASTTEPEYHLQAAYATAMLYARHLPIERRDLEHAMTWINVAIAIAGLLPDPKVRAFNTAFNQNGRALIETQRGHPERALSLLASADEQLDRDLDPDEHRLFRSVLVYNRAQVLARMGRLEDALESYRDASARDPYHRDYHLDLGDLLCQLDRGSEALAEYAIAIRLGPPSPEPYDSRAHLHTARGELDAAVRDFSYVLELDPTHVDALVNRADALAGLGEIDAAAQQVTVGLQLDPANAQLLCLRGRLALEAGDHVGARISLDAALAADGMLAEAWAIRGALHFELRNLAAALEDLSQAVALKADAAILFNRAIVHQELEHWRDAVDDLSGVLELAPDEPDGWLRRAQCRVQLGDQREAAEDARTFLKLAPHRAPELPDLALTASNRPTATL